MSRQSSQGTRFMVQSLDLPAGTALVSATKAAPCVVTFAAPPGARYVVGAIVEPRTTGWKSLDSRPFQIKAVSGNTITLADSDTTAEPNPILLGTVAVVPLTESCMATVTFTDPAGTTIDATTMCDMARVTMPGLPGLSTWQATGFWDGADATQMRLRELHRTREIAVFECIFADGTGLTFTASVNSLEVRAGVDQPVGITFGGTMTGLVSYIGTAAVIPALAEAPMAMAAD
jgi:hypothetical protein